MSGSMLCQVVKPSRRIYDGNATFVVLPGSAGEMGVYVNHAPVATTLGLGVVKIVMESGEEMRIAVSGGYADINADGVIVLANRAMPVSEIDAALARSSAEEIKAAIATLPDDDPGIAYQQERLDWVNFLAHLVG